jgi:hypothetical protein
VFRVQVHGCATNWRRNASAGRRREMDKMAAPWPLRAARGGRSPSVIGLRRKCGPFLHTIGSSSRRTPQYTCQALHCRSSRVHSFTLRLSHSTVARRLRAEDQLLFSSETAGLSHLECITVTGSLQRELRLTCFEPNRSTKSQQATPPPPPTGNLRSYGWSPQAERHTGGSKFL